jgi:hypothetical protein
VASVVARLIEPAASESLDPGQSMEIIHFIRGRIRDEVLRSVRVVLPHQGTRLCSNRRKIILLICYISGVGA